MTGVPPAGAHWIIPQWPVSGVVALMTTRQGGVSAPPFDTMNLRCGLGDDPSAVAHNQAVVARTIGATPVYLDQVHGTAVVRLTRADASPCATTHRADASVTTELGGACAVQVADCIPVLFAAARGRAVGAAHAGWRGLAHGVLEATVAALCEAADCGPEDVHVWLGPCIGAQRFEVGEDVLRAFGADPAQPDPQRFTAAQPGPPGGPHANKWLADLAGLAGDRLRRAGVPSVHGGGWCTVSDASRFYSYRRDGLTGRMAAVIARQP